MLRWISKNWRTYFVSPKFQFQLYILLLIKIGASKFILQGGLSRQTDRDMRLQFSYDWVFQALFCTRSRAPLAWMITIAQKDQKKSPERHLLQRSTYIYSTQYILSCLQQLSNPWWMPNSVSIRASTNTDALVTVGTRDLPGDALVLSG